MHLTELESYRQGMIHSARQLSELKSAETGPYNQAQNRTANATEKMLDPLIKMAKISANTYDVLMKMDIDSEKEASLQRRRFLVSTIISSLAAVAAITSVVIMVLT